MAITSISRNWPGRKLAPSIDIAETTISSFTAAEYNKLSEDDKLTTCVAIASNTCLIADYAVGILYENKCKASVNLSYMAKNQAGQFINPYFTSALVSLEKGDILLFLGVVRYDVTMAKDSFSIYANKFLLNEKPVYQAFMHKSHGSESLIFQGMFEKLDLEPLTDNDNKQQ